MTELYLSRVTLRRDAPIRALRSVLLPADDEPRTMVAHQLMWTLFGDGPERERDFLWREAGDGRFYTLSARPPVDRHDVFVIDPPKPFAPDLRDGDRLRFSLRANATVSRKVKGDKRGKPSDVVMNALHGLPEGESRAAERRIAIQREGVAWLTRQGEKHGFAIALGSGDVTVTGYRTLRLDHRRGGLKIGVLEYEGELTVTKADAFVGAIAAGFGRAKAFGCGLMLIRRA